MSETTNMLYQHNANDYAKHTNTNHPSAEYNKWTLPITPSSTLTVFTIVSSNYSSSPIYTNYSTCLIPSSHTDTIFLSFYFLACVQLTCVNWSTWTRHTSTNTTMNTLTPPTPALSTTTNRPTPVPDTQPTHHRLHEPNIHTNTNKSSDEHGTPLAHRQ